MISRRRFLTVLGATSITSGIAGAGLTLRRTGQNSVVVAPADTGYQPAQFDVPTPAPAVVQNPAALTQAQAQLTQVSAENVALKAELDALQRRLAGAEATVAEKQTLIVDLETQLAEATKGRSAALGLVALYETLEDINVGATFQSGLTAVGEAWDAFIEDLPAASEGLVQASARITEFDGQLPAFQSARTWLAVRLDLLRRENDTLQEVLKEWFTVPLGSLFEMLGNWFDDIRKWVPARFLATANKVIDSLMATVSGVPVTVDGAASNVSAVLDAWFSDDETAVERSPVIRHRLFRPLTTEALPNAVSVLQQTRIAKQKYEANLVTQVTETLSRRAIIKTQIVDYRERNGMMRAEI